MAEHRVIGRGIPRPDAYAKVMGRAIYGDDVKLPGMLCGKVLRNPYPHARIIRLDVSRAAGLRGVKAVVTADDAPDARYGPMVKDTTLFARGKVRYAGESVAAVAAVDVETAREALELIEVEYEELPYYTDPQEAAAEDAVLIHEDWESYAASGVERRGNICNHVEVVKGDVEKGFSQSDHIFTDRFEVSMVHQAYLEPHVATAVVDPTGKITIWTTTQGIFPMRGFVSTILRVPQNTVRIVPTEIGGGFGGKIHPMVEPIAVLLSMKTGAPVKILMTRQEDFMATTPRHPAIIEMKTGVKRDGTLVAREAKLYMAAGAYALSSPFITGSAVNRLTGPYRIPNIHSEGFAVYTNQPVTGAYRAPGSPQVTFAFESQMDIIADALGIDRIELRRKNALRKGEETIIGPTGESADVGEMLDRLIATSGPFKAPVKDEPSPGKVRVSGRRRKGKGIACSFWTCAGFPAGGTVKLNEDGTIAVLTGAVDLTGTNLVMAQVVAEELGLPVERISVATGDTDVAPVAPFSAGSNIARSLSTAIRESAVEMRRIILETAAEKLNTRPEGLTLQDERVALKTSPEKGLTLSEIYSTAVNEMGGPIMTSGATSGQAPTVNYVMQAAEVEVDTETGEIKVLRLDTVQDVGFALNPLSVEGQIEGGVIQGLGYGVMEEMVFQKGRLANTTLLDYKIPCSLDMPEMKTVILEEPTTKNPYGVKGVGEPPIIPTAAAIANAVSDALGVRIRSLPLTSEKILEALTEKRDAE